MKCILFKGYTFSQDQFMAFPIEYIPYKMTYETCFFVLVWTTLKMK